MPPSPYVKMMITRARATIRNASRKKNDIVMVTIPTYSSLSGSFICHTKELVTHSPYKSPVRAGKSRAKEYSTTKQISRLFMVTHCVVQSERLSTNACWNSALKARRRKRLSEEHHHWPKQKWCLSLEFLQWRQNVVVVCFRWRGRWHLQSPLCVWRIRALFVDSGWSGMEPLEPLSAFPTPPSRPNKTPKV